MVREIPAERLIVPKNDDRDMVRDFKRDFEMLPKAFQDTFETHVLETRKFFSGFAAERNLNQYVELCRKVLTLFDGVQETPKVVEDLTIEWAEFIDKQPKNEHIKRRNLAEVWLGALEQGVKAAQFLDIVRVVRGQNKASGGEMLPSQAPRFSPEQTNAVVTYAYDLQSAPMEKDPTKSYEAFADRFVGFVGAETVPVDGLRQKIEERDPLIIPWAWMLLSGDGRVYQRKFTERLANNSRITPKIVVGVADSDMIVQDGHLAPRDKSFSEELSDFLWPDGNYPRLIQGKVLTPAQRGIEYHRGDELAFPMEVDDSVSTAQLDFLWKQLQDVSPEDMIDDPMMNAALGYERPAVWLSANINLVHDLMGEESAWAQWLKEAAALKDQPSALNIPFGLDEARALLTWQVPQGLDKNRIVRMAMIVAHLNRAAGTELHHGFGGLLALFKTGFWATLAYNLDLPGEEGKGHIISAEVLDRLSAELHDEIQIAGVLGKLLSERTTNVALTVMGGSKSGVGPDTVPLIGGRTAASMQNASYAVNEAQRAYCLVEQGPNPVPTIECGHSMGGEISKRKKLLEPISVRKWFHSIASTPVATADIRAMTFLHSNINKLFDVLIDLRSSKNAIARKSGDFMNFAGRVVPIIKMLLNRFTVPYAKEKQDFRIGRQLYAVHDVTLNDIEYLREQRDAILNTNDEHTIDQLNHAISIVGGGDLSVIVGMLDTVVHPGLSLRAYRKAGNYHEIDPNTLEEKELQQWAEGVDKLDGPGHPAELVLGNIPHYADADSEGRWIFRSLFSRARRKRYGYHPRYTSKQEVVATAVGETRKILEAHERMSA